MRTKDAIVAGYVLPGELFCFGRACATPGITDAGCLGYLWFVLEFETHCHFDEGEICPRLSKLTDFSSYLVRNDI